MNKTETEKFNQTISDGFQELIKTRPEKPLEHFIYYLMSSLPEESKMKDKNLLSFFKKYEDFLLQSKESPIKRNDPTEKSLDGSWKDKDFDAISGDFDQI